MAQLLPMLELEELEDPLLAEGYLSSSRLLDLPGADSSPDSDAFKRACRRLAAKLDRGGYAGELDLDLACRKLLKYLLERQPISNRMRERAAGLSEGDGAGSSVRGCLRRRRRSR